MTLVTLNSWYRGWAPSHVGGKQSVREVESVDGRQVLDKFGSEEVEAIEKPQRDGVVRDERPSGDRLHSVCQDSPGLASFRIRSAAVGNP